MNIEGTALDTPLRRMLGIEVPVLQAGMAEAARAELVAAVSEAGGLGVLGAAPMRPELIREQVAIVRKATDRPFGINLVFPKELTTASNPFTEQIKALAEGLSPAAREDLDVLVQLMEPGFVDRQFEAAIGAGATVLVSGLGLPTRYIDAFHAAGGHVIGQVGAVSQAVRLAGSGVDAIVASGSDAGGHTGRVGSMSLWAACAKAVDIPVIASGGVADGRILAAAIVLGCQGVWVGTRFLATPEAEIHQRAKDRVVGAGTDDTVVTRAYSGKTMRVIRNAYTDSWEGRDAEILPFPLQVFATDGRSRSGLERGDVEEGAVQSGQGVGLVDAVIPAGDVVRSMADEALACFARVGA